MRKLRDVVTAEGLSDARYHHAKILQPWLDNPERRVKLHFLPAYAPNLNPIERLFNKPNTGRRADASENGCRGHF